MCVPFSKWIVYLLLANFSFSNLNPINVRFDLVRIKQIGEHSTPANESLSIIAILTDLLANLVTFEYQEDRLARQGECMILQCKFYIVGGRKTIRMQTSHWTNQKKKIKLKLTSNSFPNQQKF